jgi:seryl-tRNA synthetase
MLDIKFIRDNPELVKIAVEKKHLDFRLDDLLSVDDQRKIALVELEKKRARQNKVNEAIMAVGTDVERNRLIAEMKVLKAAIQEDEEKFKLIMEKWRALMLAVPNLPDISVPDGVDERDNVEVLTWGEKPKFDFIPKDHLELAVNLGLVDFERGSKVHGFRGYFLRDAGADLSFALWRYARDFFGKRGFKFFIAPTILRKEYFYGTGHLPKEADDLYKTQDDDYLSGTAEVAMMAYHADEVLEEKDLPLRYLAFSPCFRREAGSYGKDVKGLIRVHEFYKLEQLILARADHGESVTLHEEINRNFEEFLESLQIPYRRLLICAGDLSASKVKQYDTEGWFPSTGVYRELSSASYYHDFQTRRFNIRYKSGDKKNYVYSLNSTAAATPRLLAALLENHQQADGSVKIPVALQKYFNGDVIKKN